MNGDRDIEFPRQSNLFRKDASLDFARGIHVVIVEATFAEGDDAIVGESLTNRCTILVIELFRFVRVDSDCRPDSGVALRERDGLRVPREAVA